MSKTILIATDFSLESLNIMKKVLREKNSSHSNEQYKILLVSGYDAGDSIRDLLFNTKGKILSKIKSAEFSDALSIIKNKYPDLVSKITCDIFTGSFQRTFDQFLKTTGVDEAYYSGSLKENNHNGKFDIVPYLKRTKILDAKEVKIISPDFMPEKGKIAEVFAEV
ncbi:hypothetical protein ASG31_03315 [Chryseobacterium sp. Leaf404]|uniref:hypothetical protein n=1 Tax=unclassified Chryseobacterium TaxID=2593645 RepID=UPI000701612B|nr:MULTISPECIES: hypothetical protein [unclassified Chryseobacterium]KQT22371.1 hypothetical protein ASG31_03315 [Chryseobacterium sp. Leaf404]